MEWGKWAAQCGNTSCPPAQLLAPHPQSLQKQPHPRSAQASKVSKTQQSASLWISPTPTSHPQAPAGVLGSFYN